MAERMGSFDGNGVALACAKVAIAPQHVIISKSATGNNRRDAINCLLRSWIGRSGEPGREAEEWVGDRALALYVVPQSQRRAWQVPRQRPARCLIQRHTRR